MENKVTFSPGVILKREDLNDISNCTEEHVSTIMRGLTFGGAHSFILTKTVPTVTVNAGIITVVIPDSWAVIEMGGISYPCKINGVTKTLTGGAPKTFDIYFTLASGAATTGTRDYLTGTGSAIVKTTGLVTVKTTQLAQVDITENPVTPTDAYVLFGSIAWDGTIAPFTYSTNFWTFPGEQIGVGIHASSHITGGSDVIPSSTGSSSGLMPAGDHGLVMGSVQDITKTDPIKVITNPTDNSGGNLKTTKIELVYNTSMFVIDTGALTLNYNTGSFAGSSLRPARADHLHTPLETPYYLDSVKILIEWDKLTAANYITIEYNVPISELYGGEVFWSETGDAPLFTCGWWKENSGTIGSRIIITGKQKYKIEVGTYGVARIPSSMVSPGFSYQSKESGEVPLGGYLIVRLYGRRW